MNGAPWETISELFSFVAIQKPTRTQPKVLEFVKCQSINGALACAPATLASLYFTVSCAWFYERDSEFGLNGLTDWHK